MLRYCPRSPPSGYEACPCTTSNWLTQAISYRPSVCLLLVLPLCSPFRHLSVSCCEMRRNGVLWRNTTVCQASLRQWKRGGAYLLLIKACLVSRANGWYCVLSSRRQSLRCSSSPTAERALRRLSARLWQPREKQS